MTTESTIPMGRYKAEATATGTEPYKRTYQYTPLSDPKTQFRLATIEPSVDHASQIECTLSVHNLSEPPDYVAISYVCGDPHDTREVSVDNANLAIYSTLDNAIRHMRKVDAPLVLWADALCIHQSDDHEKSLQVGTMSMIYGNADRVFGWLGPANETFLNALRTLELFGTDPTRRKVSEFLDEYVQIWYEGGSGLKLRHGSPLKSLAADIARDMTQAALPDVARRSQNRIEKAFQKVYAKHRSRTLSWAMETVFGPSGSTAIIMCLQNSKFLSRTWIYQELALAERLTLLCGDCSYDGDKVLVGLHSLLCFLGPFRPFEDRSYDWKEIFLWHRTGEMIVQLRSSSRGRQQATVQSLLDLIVSFSGASCADPRDKVFALLALTSDPLVGRNPADYSLSAIQVASRLTRSHVDETHSLDILHFCGRGNAPSWAMDLAAVIETRYVRGSSVGCKYRTASALHAKATVDDANSDPGSFRLAGAHLCTIQKVAHWQGFLPETTEGPYDEWWRLAKSVGYDELDFWLALSAVPRESHHDDSELQRQRKKLRAWLEQGSNGVPVCLRSDLRENVIHKMFVTDSGRLGLYGEHAKEGDQVCVLFGGDVPYILRPSPVSSTECQYTLVEPCYLDGVMEGELIEKIKTGELEEKVFALV